MRYAEYTMKMQPNTTQVPNHILDDLMPLLSGTETKVLLVVVRQTLGWQADAETGRRKEQDWISGRYFTTRTGASARAITAAVDRLVKIGAIEIVNSEGKSMENSQSRQMEGGRLFYRLVTRKLGLFDRQTLAKNTKGLAKIAEGVSKNVPPQKLPTTKETLSTKETITKGEAQPPSAREFFESKEQQRQLAEYLISKGSTLGAAEEEVRKFVNYWTEPNKRGTAVRWEVERFFDLRRRIVTWIGKANEYGKKQKSKVGFMD